MGEVQTLLIEDKFAAPGVQCTNCSHIDINMSHTCGVCGQPTIGVEDIADPLLARAMAAGIELQYVPANGELDRVGRIAALLRFRADQRHGDEASQSERRKLERRSADALTAPLLLCAQLA